ncbi:hypothetical protein BGP_2547 [Beggiatoa sp. PS]|nr:hypothetical protein BGP_2547 [Beggiatoa sp. PS]
MTNVISSEAQYLKLDKISPSLEMTNITIIGRLPKSRRFLAKSYIWKTIGPFVVMFGNGKKFAYHFK